MYAGQIVSGKTVYQKWALLPDLVSWSLVLQVLQPSFAVGPEALPGQMQLGRGLTAHHSQIVFNIYCVGI